MDPNIIITPAAGAVIGYFTNYLAIKMLFRPYEAKYIFGMKVPFTPGLIPKEKLRIAKSLGDAISTHLLNKNVVMDALTKDDVLNSINSMADSVINNIKEKDITLSAFCSETLGMDYVHTTEKLSAFLSKTICSSLSDDELKGRIADEIYIKAGEILHKPLCELPYNQLADVIRDVVEFAIRDTAENEKFKADISNLVWTYLCSKREDERRICEIMSPSTQRDLKDYVAMKTPAAVNMLLSATEDEEVERMLKSKLSNAIFSIGGPMIGMFVNVDNMYVRIIEQLTQYINNPENMPEIESAVDKIADRIMDSTCGSIIASLTGEVRENMLMKGISFAFDEAIRSNGFSAITDRINDFFEDNKNRSVMDMLMKADANSDDKIREIIFSLTEKLLGSITEDDVEGILSSLLEYAGNTNLSSALSSLSSESIAKAKETFIGIYKKCVETAAPKIISAFDISSVAQAQIESFSMTEIERIIVEIADRELKSITAVGGVLGFIIGFVPVITSLI